MAKRRSRVMLRPRRAKQGRLRPRFASSQLRWRSGTRPWRWRQLWIAWDHHGNGIDRDHKLYGLFVLIAQQRVGDRPGRIELRAIKRRPKPYPLLTQPREIARANVRKYGHPKKLK